MPVAVERVGRDHAGDERAVTVGVLAATSRRRTSDLPATRPANSGWPRSMPGVDHRDLDLGSSRSLPARSPRPGPARGTTASPRTARCSRTRRAATRAGARRAGSRSARRGRADARRGRAARGRARACGRRGSCAATRANCPGGAPTAQRAASESAGAQSAASTREEQRRPHGTASSCETPGESPRPGAQRTRYEPGASAAATANEPRRSGVARRDRRPRRARSGAAAAPPRPEAAAARCRSRRPRSPPRRRPARPARSRAPRARRRPRAGTASSPRGVTRTVKRPFASGVTGATVCHAPPAGLRLERDGAGAAGDRRSSCGARRRSAASRRRVEREPADREPRRAQAEQRADRRCRSRSTSPVGPTAVTVATWPDGPSVGRRSSRPPVTFSAFATLRASNSTGPQSWFGESVSYGIGDRDEVRDRRAERLRRRDGAAAGARRVVGGDHLAAVEEHAARGRVDGRSRPRASRPRCRRRPGCACRRRGRRCCAVTTVVQARERVGARRDGLRLERGGRPRASASRSRRRP